MLKQSLIAEVSSSNQFFNKSSGCLSEEDSNFKPMEELMTVAQHVQHAADTFHWFLDGAFSDAFDIDFSSYSEKIKKASSLTTARNNFSAAVERAMKEIESRTDEEWQAPIKDPSIMPGAPRYAIFSAISEHTTHHLEIQVNGRIRGKASFLLKK